MSQTTVSTDIPTALEGALVYTPAELTISRFAKTAMPFGRVMVWKVASGAESCDLPTLTTDLSSGRQLGIGVWDPAKEPNPALGYNAGQMVQIVRRGYVWMLCETAAQEGDNCFVRFALVSGTGSAPAIGKVRNNVDTADAVAVPGIRFASTIAAAGLVQVEINLP